MLQFHKSGVWTGGESQWISLYDGDWDRGVFEGKGHIIFDNGDSYKGAFERGVVWLLLLSLLFVEFCKSLSLF